MRFFTELKEGLAISLGAIRAHKLRSTLTTIGIVIGIVTVTLMGTVIQGLNSAFLKSISVLGADTLHVSRESWGRRSEEEWQRSQRRTRITLAQGRAVAEGMKTAQAVALITQQPALLPVRFQDRRSDAVFIVGTTEQYLLTAGLKIAQGHFLTAEECQGGRPVCVIGFQVASNLFLHQSAIGKRLEISGRKFEVVGVLEKQGGLFGVRFDNQILIPLLQFSGTFRRWPDLAIDVKAPSLAALDTTREELHGVMRRVRHLAPGQQDDFSINSQENILEVWHRVGGTIAGVGLFITGLSLFVGGIGIMNIMFVSVAERTKEIGIRKAIGAKRRAILIQFLSEAACICLLGSLIALAIAWPTTFLISKFMPSTMSLGIVGIALLVSLLTGVISGFVPAWRAARMNPVDALRSE